MTTVNLYRVYCTTDSKYVNVWSTDEPVTCPENNGHSINTDATSIIQTISETEISVKEEDIPTGGNFSSRTIKMIAPKNTITTYNLWWSYPISALAVEFITAETHRGDNISMHVGPDTTIGVLTANISSASAWISQNYTIGQRVTYTHPTFGSRVYTCIANTVSNELPTNTTYWVHGLEISVSSTVLIHAKKGYFIKLTDGVNSDDFLTVINIDTLNNKIYVDKNITNSYSAATPTYIQQTVSIFSNYELNEPWEHTIGESKIGGSYVPTDTIVQILYDNKSSDTDKTFVGRVEYLY